MKNWKSYLGMVLMVILFTSCNNMPNKIGLASPDGNNTIEFVVNKNGVITYALQKGEEVLVSPSKLGFVFKDKDRFDNNFEIIDYKTSTFNETWTPVVGEYKSIQNHYNELKVCLREKSGKQRKMNVFFRLFNDGLGFRYEIPQQDHLSKIEIASEETQFKIDSEAKAWWIPGDFGSYENIYNESLVAVIDSANTPVTFETQKGSYLSIHEANLLNYSDMTLKTDNQGGLYCNLVPWPDGIKVKSKTPMLTPWRTIQIGNNAGDLIESSLILNLNEPNKIEDTSWIKPMKYLGVWWTVHLGFETFEVGKHQAAVTQKAKKIIDAAHKFGMKGVLVEGWNKGWDLRGKSNEIPNFLEAEDNYDIKEVAEYAQEKGIELIVHHETFGNIDHYEKNMEPSFQWMKALGLNCIKGGYAGSIFPKEQHKHGQWMVNHYTKLMETAAKYGIMMDIHEPIKQTGLRRTYPNLMTVEGVRGMEFAAWSEGNPPSHTVTIPFTRGLAGPIDYNAGIFDIKFESLKNHEFNWRMPKKKYPKNPGPCVKTTLAKQLALHVVLFSPMQMSPDLPENYDGHPAFKFLQDVDVVWDDTKVLNASIGDYLTIARKGKNTDEWFIGSITNEEEREFDIKLNFLDADKKYEAVIYADAQSAHWDRNPTAYQISTKQISKYESLHIKLAAGGGQAISIKPVE